MSATKPAYRLTLGASSFSSSGLPADAGGLLGAALAAAAAVGLPGAASGPALLAVRVDMDLDAPGALDVWFGAAKNLEVEPGDAAKLELGYDTSVSAVFSGSVHSVEPDLESVHVRALTDFAKLFSTRINQVYENQSAGQIVSDLAAQAGLTTGRIQPGLDLPFYVVDDLRNAAAHCRDLAERAGFDLYVTPGGELTFAPFDKVSADHRFSYAQDVLSLQIAATPLRFERVEVWGESPASSEGVEAASWLVRDFSGSVGSAGSGALLRVSDPALRTRDAAGLSARGRLDVLTRRATFGEAELLGAPAVALGQSVSFVDAPDARLGGVFQVKRVTHAFDKSGGFTTRLEVIG